MIILVYYRLGNIFVVLTFISSPKSQETQAVDQRGCKQSNILCLNHFIWIEFICRHTCRNWICKLFRMDRLGNKLIINNFTILAFIFSSKKIWLSWGFVSNLSDHLTGCFLTCQTSFKGCCLVPRSQQLTMQSHQQHCWCDWLHKLWK